MGDQPVPHLLWEPLRDFFNVLIQEILTCNGRLWSTIAHHETQVFPFTGYLALSKNGIPGEEDLVLTLGVQRKGDRLFVRADIARGDGFILADGPAAEIAGSPLDVAALLEARDRALQFFSERQEVVIREVCEGGHTDTPV